MRFSCSVLACQYSITLHARVVERECFRFYLSAEAYIQRKALNPTEETLSPRIETIAIIGAGTMGHGIAHVAATAGFQVFLFDVNMDAVERGLTSVKRNLAKGIERGKVTEDERDRALERIVAATDFSSLRAADLFIEAVPEAMDLKRETLRQVEQIVEGKPFIFASNTSSLSITEIAKSAARPDRVVGMHFFNPVHVMRLLEIVLGEKTSEETLNAARAVATQMRKEAITVRDVPGFASSRLGVALGLEAMRMLEQNVASAKDIDTAMELGYNHPMGPLRLTDVVGLDVRLKIAEYLHSALESESFRPPEILRRMVQEGKLGKKTGEGFYRWDDEGAATGVASRA